MLNLLAVYVTALYNEYENSKYKLLIIRLLIISVLVYFIVLIFCHCIMLMYGDIIKEKANLNDKDHKEANMFRIIIFGAVKLQNSYLMLLMTIQIL